MPDKEPPAGKRTFGPEINRTFGADITSRPERGTCRRPVVSLAREARHQLAVGAGPPDGQRRRQGVFHPVPRPARCKARQAKPTSIRLVGLNTASVAIAAALIRNAMANRMAAMKA